MLSHLKIENVAVIKSTDIDFSKGLNILTGETGAGKSIVIDSINAILGERTSKEIVRSGCDKARIIAEFTDLSDSIIHKLSDYEIECEDETLIIMRTITSDGKSNCRINGMPVTSSILKDIGRELITICGQHDSQKLLQRSSHIDYIDALGELYRQLSDYKSIYKELKELENELNSLSTDESQKQTRIEFLEYQINEIQDASLYEGEKETLVSQKKRLLNRDKTEQSLRSIEQIINGSDEFQGITDMLYQLIQQLDIIKDTNTDFSRFSELTQNFKYELEDCLSATDNELMSLDYEEISLDEIENRLDVIYKLSRKYGPEIEDVLSYLENAKKELESIQTSDERIAELEIVINENIEQLIAQAKEISLVRKSTAVNFENSIKSELDFLDMTGADFKVSFNETEPMINGIDTVEFLFSANAGQEMKPLSKIASGGELSRVMLAIRCVLSKIEDVQTSIFDEIDSGVSGRAANKIARKLKQVSEDKQVICVTHLAQIAACADNHLYIEKKSENNESVTNVYSLSYEQRIAELARIIGGDVVTQSTLDSAKELIKYSN